MKDITIHLQATIMQAMEALDKTAEKLLLVVNESKTLIGTLSDGDIRRSILRGCDLTDSIQEACNRNPIFVYKDEFDQTKIKNILRKNKIDLVPVLDREHQIIDFVTWERLFGESKDIEKPILDVPLVIMAGGKGTRLEPFTKVLPKPLIPVGDKTVIDHIIDKFRNCGVNEFYLTLNHMAKILRAYFEEKEPEYKIGFIEENEFRGTAGSLKLLKDTLKTQFFVSNCDIIIKTNYSDIHQFHINGGYDITMVAATKQFNLPYGICELNSDGSLKNIKEKPGYNFLVNTGLYVLNPEILHLIPDHGIFHMLHLMDKVKENSGTIGVYPISENSWTDVGQWAEYKEALKDLSL